MGGEVPPRKLREVIVTGHRAVCTALALLCVAAIGGGLARACTPSAEIGISPSAGPPGSQLTISGNSFSSGTVRIHFDSASGPVIAEATGPEFSTSGTIPSASPGTHYIVAVASGGQASKPFTITAAGGGGRTAPQADSVAPTPAAGAPTPRAPAPTRPTQRRSERAGGKTERRAGARNESRRKTRAGAGSRAAQREAAVTIHRGEPVFAGSIGARSSRSPIGAGSATERGAAARAGPPVRARRGPSSASALDDLWSGFRSNGRPAPSVGEEGVQSTTLTLALLLVGLGGAFLMVALAAALPRARRARRAARD